MLTRLKVFLLAATIALASCSTLSSSTAPTAKLTFQNGQTAIIRLDGPDLALRHAFLTWAGQGAYMQTPIYRQLPGIFVLTGKPRLAGNGFLTGQHPSPNADDSSKQPPATKYGQIGLVMHQDGTAGPEIILMYGHKVVTCCEEPASIAIGTIIEGRRNLGSVQRGDNLENIVIEP